MPTMTTWVVKLSKFCNMRCSYCYEWNELSDRTRMSMAVWERVVQAALDHTAILEARHQRRGAAAADGGLRQQRSFDHRNLIVFHGGEPLALPTSHWRRLLTRFRELTRDTNVKFALSVQSNLLSIQQEKLDLLLEHGVQLAVSFDLVPGVRLNVAGQPTEQTVARNIDLLLARGIKLGAIAVLAKHTVDHVAKIHDFFADRQMGMRILPLFDGPPQRDTSSFWVDHATLQRGLQAMFRHWIEAGCRIQVDPLGAYFESALRYMAGLYRLPWRREHWGDSILLINVDGRVYRVLDAYDGRLSLGSFEQQSIAEILASESHRLSIERDRAEFMRHCDKCEYYGACNGSWIYASRISDGYEGRCPTAHSCISFMIDYVKEKGYDVTQLRAILEAVGERRSEAVAVAG